MENVIRLDPEAQKHLQAYIDYNYYAGSDAKAFTPEEYEKLKKKQLSCAKTKVYVTYRNINGRDCKSIGPATKCFCDHRYKEHNYLNPINKKVSCNVKGCKCQCFDYIPTHGSYDFKCHCKHSYRDHDLLTKKCKKCKGCNGFHNTWSCSCEMKYAEHKTTIETRQERIAGGRAISEVEQILLDPGTHGTNVNNNNMNSFMQLIDGEERFGTQIEYMEKNRNEQLALGYQNPNALVSGNSKKTITSGDNFDQDALDHLNSRMEAEKSYNQHSLNNKMPGGSGRNNQIPNDSYNDPYNDDNRAMQVASRNSKGQAIAKPGNYMGNHGMQLQGQKSAYDLYCTPHQYVKVKAPLKRIGYK